MRSGNIRARGKRRYAFATSRIFQQMKDHARTEREIKSPRRAWGPQRGLRSLA
jgi:hypothetical protein